MKIVVLYKEENGADYHRLIIPYRTLKTEPGNQVLLFSNKAKSIPLDLIKDADYVIFNRICPFNIDIILEWRDIYGFKIVADLDDYWELYPHHILYSSWKLNGSKEKMVHSLEIADIVTTSTELLRDKIAAINKNVFVIPNGIDFDSDKGNVIEDNIKVIYTGGTSHYYDLKTIEHTITRMNELKNMDLIIAGYNNQTSETSEFWNKIQNIVLKNKRSFFKYHLPLESYMEHYDVANLALAPLEDNYFNHFKSPLKIFEAGSKSLPIICSNISPYKEFEGIPGVRLAKNNREWFDHLKSYSKNPSILLSEGKELHDFVYYNYNLEHVNKLRWELLNNFKN